MLTHSEKYGRIVKSYKLKGRVVMTKSLTSILKIALIAILVIFLVAQFLPFYTYYMGTVTYVHDITFHIVPGVCDGCDDDECDGYIVFGTFTTPYQNEATLVRSMQYGIQIDVVIPNIEADRMAGWEHYGWYVGDAATPTQATEVNRMLAEPGMVFTAAFMPAGGGMMAAPPMVVDGYDEENGYDEYEGYAQDTEVADETLTEQSVAEQPRNEDGLEHIYVGFRSTSLAGYVWLPNENAAVAEHIVRSFILNRIENEYPERIGAINEEIARLETSYTNHIARAQVDELLEGYVADTRGFHVSDVLYAGLFFPLIALFLILLLWKIKKRGVIISGIAILWGILGLIEYLTNDVLRLGGFAYYLIVATFAAGLVVSTIALIAGLKNRKA